MFYLGGSGGAGVLYASVSSYKMLFYLSFCRSFVKLIMQSSFSIISGFAADVFVFVQMPPRPKGHPGNVGIEHKVLLLCCDSQSQIMLMKVILASKGKTVSVSVMNTCQ
jgi:hypothetical protein